MTRNPEAGRLAARLLLLHAYDPQAAQFLARAAELHMEACRQLQVVEAQQVAAAQQIERVSGSRSDETATMLALVAQLAAVAGGWRALVKARRMALRRLAAAYEDALGYRHGRFTTLAGSDQDVTAITWTDPKAPTGRRTERPASKED